jgi:hypothetical protein
MSNFTATRQPSLTWLCVNGTLAAITISATVGENSFCLTVVNVVIVFYLLLATLNATIPGILKNAAKRLKPTKIFMATELLYDAAMLTLLCLYAPWYTWIGYFIATIFSVNNLLKIRYYAITSPA